MSDVRLRPSQWKLLARLAAVDEELEGAPAAATIDVGFFNQGTYIVSPTVADAEVNEADLTALVRADVLNVVTQTSSLMRLRVAQSGFDALRSHRAETNSPPVSEPIPFEVDAPREVQQRALDLIAAGNRLQQQGDISRALEAYRQAWGTKLSAQPAGRRFHKGAELSWLASAYTQAGLLREGLRWWLAAFLEDAISRTVTSPSIRDELHWPAAQALRQLGIGEQRLSLLSERTRQMAAHTLIADPMTVFVAEGLDGLLEQVRERIAPPPPPNVRVFVSSPGDLRRERRLVARVCQDLSTILRREVRALLWEGAGANHPESPPFPAEVTGAGPQAVIDDHIRDALGGYDIYVGMMWRRMGTPTGQWRSGTEAEFRYALDGYQRSGRPRKLLFYTKKLGPNEVRSPEASAFIEELEGQLGLPQRFRTGTELHRLLVSDLSQEVRGMYR